MKPTREANPPTRPATVQPSRSRPSPPLQPSVVFLPSPRSCCVLARARPRGHLLLADELLAAWTTSAGRPDPPDPPHSPVHLFPLSLLRLPRPLSRSRAQPPTPFAVAAATALPSLPRLAQRLRLDPLFLPIDPRASGSPASPPTSPFPSSATGDRRRRFESYRTSPSPLTIPAAPR